MTRTTPGARARTASRISVLLVGTPGPVVDAVGALARVDRSLASADPTTGSATGLRDPLTGLVAGDRLLEDIDRMIADAVGFCRPLTVAVLDLDDTAALERALGADELVWAAMEAAGPARV